MDKARFTYCVRQMPIYYTHSTLTLFEIFIDTFYMYIFQVTTSKALQNNSVCILYS